jgi:hypothetical protein
VEIHESSRYAVNIGLAVMNLETLSLITFLLTPRILHPRKTEGENQAIHPNPGFKQLKLIRNKEV